MNHYLIAICLYSTPSNQSGVGSEARANVVVGLGGSIIDFEIINQGYGYGESQKLTIGVGGAVGIPTAGATEFREFQLNCSMKLLVIVLLDGQLETSKY